MRWSVACAAVMPNHIPGMLCVPIERAKIRAKNCCRYAYASGIWSTYMLLKRLHHIGIAVHDLDVAIALYRATFGVADWERINLPEQYMQVAVCHIGEQMLEFLMPTSDQAPVARFLQTRGEGTHHLAYQVDDLEAALRSLENKGVRLIDRHARPGIHDTKIAFIHPKAMQGVLVELVEESRPGGD